MWAMLTLKALAYWSMTVFSASAHRRWIMMTRLASRSTGDQVQRWRDGCTDLRGRPRCSTYEAGQARIGGMRAGAGQLILPGAYRPRGGRVQRENRL